MERETEGRQRMTVLVLVLSVIALILALAILGTILWQKIPEWFLDREIRRIIKRAEKRLQK